MFKKAPAQHFSRGKKRKCRAFLEAKQLVRNLFTPQFHRRPIRSVTALFFVFPANTDPDRRMNGQCAGIGTGGFKEQAEVCRRKKYCSQLNTTISEREHGHAFNLFKLLPVAMMWKCFLEEVLVAKGRMGRSLSFFVLVSLVGRAWPEGQL